MAKKDGRIRFVEWCREDIDDTRRIHYEVNVGGKTYKFTSDDTMETAHTPFGIGWLSDVAMIDDIRLENDEWYVKLSD